MPCGSVRGATTRIGRLTTDGEHTSFPLPTPGCAPLGITSGPDGALWCAGMQSDLIGRITPDGDVREASLGTSGGMPSAIAAGPDGAVARFDVDGPGAASAAEPPRT